MKHLDSFDITNSKRRSRVAKECLAHGFRVQKSVFEIFLDNNQLNNFEETLLHLINPETDSIRIYPIDKTADESLRTVGNGKKIEIGNCTII